MLKQSRMTLAMLLSALTLIVAARALPKQASLAAARAQATAAQQAAAEPKQKRPNRLIKEKSPYLLQHAYNPVDWYPWGAEAFAKARQENKLIFLSIGYSTCFWCHQMGRQVFENEEVAALMNKYFVSIKVDREERPDVDRIYLTALLTMRGGGGWPLSLFLTPELKPFYGATFIPPTQFRELSDKIHEVWQTNPASIRQPGQQLTELLKQQTSVAAAGAKLEQTILTKGFEQFSQTYDQQYAGFGQGSKFARPVAFNFLLRYHARFGNQAALQMTLATLRKLAQSGLYDHLGGGFHRYSVDREWRVPHFEKMLYDQAQLSASYLDAYQLTQDEFYAAVARATLNYVLREMTGKEGGFYSAEDAESATDPAKPQEKEEGAFYVWTKAELDRLLGKELAGLFSYVYGIRAEGNALADPQRVFVGKNLFYLAQSIDLAAKRFKQPAAEIVRLLAESRAKLLAARSQRPRPHLDDKILVSWNGLMISALARAGRVLGEPAYQRAAEKGAEFILNKLYEPKTKRLLRRYRDGEARYDANLADYAFFIQGLLDLYEAAPETRWLQQAIELTGQQNALFYDDERGGFFDTSGEDATLLFRTKEDFDGAEPTGNSSATLNLLRLAQMTDNQKWRALAERTLALFSGRLHEQPQALPQMLAALDFQLDKPKQIIIAGNRGSADTEQMLRAAHARYLPNKIILLADGGAGQQFLTQYLPFIETVKMRGGKATAYICENYACKLPTSDLSVMARLLAGKMK